MDMDELRHLRAEENEGIGVSYANTIRLIDEVETLVRLRVLALRRQSAYERLATGGEVEARRMQIIEDEVFHILLQK